MKITKALKSTAYHEAGHGVAAWTLEVRTQSLSIVPEDGTLGLHTSKPYFNGVHPEYDDSPRCHRRLENKALVCMAGPAAQRRFNPKGYRHYHGEDDFHQAIDLLSYISGGGVLEAHVALIDARARAFVENRINWVAIEALAGALLDRKKLSGREIRPIIRAALEAAYISRV